MSHGVEGENARVVVVSIPCPRHHVITYRKQVHPGSVVTVNKAPKKTKLKIRAQQGGPHPVVDAPLLTVPIPDARYFICQPSWSKIFLPTLTQLLFVSEYPFKSFRNKSSTLLSIVQEAFDATYPNVSYTVTDGDNIVLVVRPYSIHVHAPWINQLYPSQQSLDWLKTKCSLIASDVMKIVKTYFEDARFVNQAREVKAHAWWGLRPDGLGYHAKPASIDVNDPGSAGYIVSDQHPLVSLVNE